MGKLYKTELLRDLLKTSSMLSKYEPKKNQWNQKQAVFVQFLKNTAQKYSNCKKMWFGLVDCFSTAAIWHIIIDI